MEPTATTVVLTLTPQQTKVYDLLSDGKTPKQIAKALKISTNGVYGHMRRIKKAGVPIPTPGSLPARGVGARTTNDSSGNGKAPASVQMAQLVKDAIKVAEERLSDIRDERQAIADEQTKLSVRDEALAKEEADLAASEKALDGTEVARLTV